MRHHGLYLGLWMVWTMAVGGTACYQWVQDASAHVAFNTLAMVIHCAVVGILGLVVLTDIEFWLDQDV